MYTFVLSSAASSFTVGSSRAIGASCKLLSDRTCKNRGSTEKVLSVTRCALKWGKRSASSSGSNENSEKKLDSSLSRFNNQDRSQSHSVKKNPEFGSERFQKRNSYANTGRNQPRNGAPSRYTDESLDRRQSSFRYRDEAPDRRGPPSRYRDERTESYGSSSAKTRGFDSERDFDERYAADEDEFERDYDAEEDDRYKETEVSELQNVMRSGNDFVYGVSSVLAALAANRREFIRLYVQESTNLAKRKDKNAVVQIHELARKMQVEVKYMNKGDMNNMANQRPHQGFILQAEQLQTVNITALPTHTATESRPPVWLVLDEVWDPQNFGALLRSAYFLGVSGVAVSAKNSCPLSPVVSKASVGALEKIEVHAARNLVRFLEESRENGWRVVGTSLRGDAIDSKQLTLDQPTIVVLGNEGHGLRTNVSNQCNVHVRIPGREDHSADSVHSDDDSVDSLNVSVAGGVLLYQLLA